MKRSHPKKSNKPRPSASGQAVTDLRVSLGVASGVLAKGLDVDRSTISVWELGTDASKHALMFQRLAWWEADGDIEARIEAFDAERRADLAALEPEQMSCDPEPEPTPAPGSNGESTDERILRIVESIKADFRAHIDWHVGQGVGAP